MNMSSVQAKAFEIVQALNAGNHAQARRMCEKAIRRNPKDPVLNHLHASVAYVMQDYPLALRAVETSLVAHPANLPARLLAGRVARALGRLETAERHFAMLPPAMPEARSELARTLELSGKRKDAKKAWSEARARDPGSREAAARFGRLLWEDGEFSEARQHLEFAVEGEAPASAWFDLGLVLQDCGDLEDAAKAFEVALSRRPDDAQAAFNLGAALQQLGHLDRAVGAYRRAYSLSPLTLGMIANALSSMRSGMLFIDKASLIEFLDS